MSDVNLTLQDNGGVYLAITETPAVVTLSQAVISGALSSTVTVANVVTVALDSNSLAALENVTVTVGSAVSVSGTVTANVAWQSGEFYPFRADGDSDPNFGAGIVFQKNDYGAAIVGDNNPFPISGSVTANVVGLDQQDGITNAKFPVIGFDTGIETANSGYVVPVQISNPAGAIGSANPLPVSGFPAIQKTSERLSRNGGETFEESDYISCTVIEDYYQVGLNRILPETFVADGEVTAKTGPNDVKKQVAILQAFGSSGIIYDISSYANGTIFALEPLQVTGSPIIKAEYRNSANTNGQDIIVTNAFKGTSTTNISTQDVYVFRKDTSLTHIRLAWVSGTGTASYYLKAHSNPYYGIETQIAGTVTANITNSITVGALPVQLSTTTIGGTARLNVTLSSATTVGATAPSYANLYGGSDGTNLRAISVDSSGRTVVTGTTSILGTSSVTFGAVTGSVSVLGTPSVTMGAISGTVTANNPSGALTTRFGSVTTANLAQISSAVTNTSRKYLLCQNISSGTVTIGIGFSPTTTQGIQLSAGGGLSFDAFCPTGAVWWLSATTGANFTILEG